MYIMLLSQKKTMSQVLDDALQDNNSYTTVYEWAYSHSIGHSHSTAGPLTSYQSSKILISVFLLHALRYEEFITQW